MVENGLESTRQPKGADDDWVSTLSHPPAGTLLYPTNSARLRAVMLGVAMVVPMMALIPLLNRYHYLGLAVLVDPELLMNFERIRGYLLLIYTGVILVIWYLSFSLANLAGHIRRARCYPPPGSKVLFTTELVVGKESDWIKRFCNISATLLLLMAVVMFVGLIQFYIESVALQEALGDFVAMFG
ncbi:MAG: hypothetical protein KUG54_01630 [Gammaproteobacteria bacterium]|nr:hypothetical protein [Gammaproteobacteria bacterium]